MGDYKVLLEDCFATRKTIATYRLVAILFATFMVASPVNLKASPWNESAPGGLASPPNVVFILSDDQGWGDYSFMGHPQIQTPNLDRLAKESLTFKRGYVPDSLCRPSLASIITGLYPHQHGIVGNDPPLPLSMKGVKGKPYADPRYIEVREDYFKHIARVPTLPRILKKVGYESLQTGKWWEGNFARGGFDQGMTHGDMKKGGRHGDAGLKIGREGMAVIDEFVESNSKQGKPFFLWYAPIMPHTPHDPPKRLLEKYQSKTPHLPVAKYWAMCEWFDETIGELRSVLKKHKVDDNTMIVYVCDNGWINDEKESKYAPRSKRSPNEGGVRTPIMIHLPGRVEPKMDDQHLACSVDLVPTVLAALNLKPETTLPGVNLLDAAAVAKRTSLCGEIFEHDIVSMDDPQASLMYRWIIDGDLKLIEPYQKRMKDEKPALYDLSKDPNELVDLASKKSDEVMRLSKKLNEHWKLAE